MWVVKYFPCFSETELTAPGSVLAIAKFKKTHMQEEEDRC